MEGKDLISAFFSFLCVAFTPFSKYKRIFNLHSRMISLEILSMA